MTLADELMRKPVPMPIAARRILLEEPPLRLPFNGALSPDEWRMLEQFIEMEAA